MLLAVVAEAYAMRLLLGIMSHRPPPARNVCFLEGCQLPLLALNESGSWLSLCAGKSAFGQEPRFGSGAIEPRVLNPDILSFVTN